MVARNLYFNYINKKTRQILLDDLGKDLPDKDNISDKIILDEKMQTLYRGLQKLDIRKREVIEMQYFGGLSQKEIAHILKLTPENVRIISYRGKKELKRYMEENGYDI